MAKKKKVVLNKRKIKKSVKSVSKKAAIKPKKKVLAIPKGYHSITPYLIVENAKDAIHFYKQAFGAKQMIRMDRPDGKVAHAELKIGDSKIMLGDPCPEKGAFSPQRLNSCPISIHLYVKNVDAVVKSAVKAGAKLTRPVENMFYGDRSAMLADPYYHHWCVSTHIEDVSPAKLKKRVAELFDKK
jgi:PhnB protein